MKNKLYDKIMINSIYGSVNTDNYFREVIDNIRIESRNLKIDSILEKEKEEESKTLSKDIL